MKTLLRTTLLTALFANLVVLPAGANEVNSILTDDISVGTAELAETCTRESRRPIAEVVSGRCTDEEPEHYFVDALPQCDCRLETDHEGLTVLRLTLPQLASLPVVPAKKQAPVQAVFKRDLSRPAVVHTF